MALLVGDVHYNLYIRRTGQSHYLIIMSTTTSNCTDVQQLQHQKEMALGALRAAEATYLTKNEALDNLLQQLDGKYIHGKCFHLHLQEEIAFRTRRRVKAAYMAAERVLLEYKCVAGAVTSQEQDALLPITCGVCWLDSAPTPLPLPTLTKKYRRPQCIYPVIVCGRIARSGKFSVNYMFGPAPTPPPLPATPTPLPAFRPAYAD